MTFLLAPVIILMTLATYWPAVHCGYIWDDNHYVQNNRHLRSLEGLKNIWLAPRATPQYYPLVHTTYWIEYHLWKLNAAGYHLVNILLHSLSAVLLWRVLSKLKIPGAWAVAAIFAVHPVAVESVAWITERKNVLSGVFYFSSVLAYLKFAFANIPTIKPSKKWYVIALIFFVCALLSKTVTATLPGALLLILWWKRDRLRWRDILYLIPFFVIGAAMGLFTAWLEVHHVGAKGDEWTLTFLERFLVAGRALCFYAAKIVWPHPLIFFYDRWNVSQTVWQQYLFLIPFPAVVFAFWKLRHRFGRGPIVAVLFFAGTLFPALGFLDVYPMIYSYVADHFQYLAMIGVISLIAAAGATLAKRHPKKLKAPLLVLLVGALAACGVLTARQCTVYKDLETLWKDIIAKRPDPWMAYNNLGILLNEQKKIDEAVECFEKTIKIKSDDYHACNNLATLYRIQKKYDEAFELIHRAIDVNPQYAFAHFTYAQLLFDRGRTEQGINELNTAIKLKPDYAKARCMLGIKLSQMNRSDEALHQLYQVLKDEPDHPGALTILADIYKSINRFDKAIEYNERLLTLAPNNSDILNNLAWLLAACPDPQWRNPDRAVALAKQACDLSNYRIPELISTLAAAHAANGNVPLAITTAQQALQLARQIQHHQLVQQLERQIASYQKKIQ